MVKGPHSIWTIGIFFYITRYKAVSAISVHLLFLCSTLWSRESPMEEIESVLRTFKFSWLHDDIGQRTICQALSHLWSTMLLENNDKIDFTNTYITTFFTPLVILFNYSKIRVNLNLDALRLPHHILRDPRCRIGVRLKNIFNPLNYPKEQLDHQSRNDLELLEMARDGSFEQFFDLFVMRPTRNRFVSFLAISNFGQRPQWRNMIFSHLRCHEFRALKRMFASDIQLIREIDYFLSDRAHSFFDGLRTNYAVTIASAVMFDRSRRLIPDRLALIPHRETITISDERPEADDEASNSDSDSAQSEYSDEV